MILIAFGAVFTYTALVFFSCLVPT